MSSSLVSRHLKKEELEGPLALDEYDYSVDVLENGVKLVLITSPKVDRAAIALGVGCGSLHDPPPREGLAHFLEHMLFMGNAKYPNEEEYQEYVVKNGGGTNAFTSLVLTLYYATCKPEAIDGLIDRHCEFFISPFFKKDAVSREIEAVHAEWEKSLQVDDWRDFHLTRMLSNPDHPFNAFSIGNNESLKKLDQYPTKDEAYTALRNSLLEFYDKHYSSNIMTCCVVANTPLEQLRETTIARLNKIRNANVVRVPGQMFGGVKPYTDKEMGVMVSIVPVAPVRTVEFRFAVPDQTPLWESKPGSFIAHVLGHEGAGSILSVLKKKGLATQLEASCDLESCDQSLFTVKVSVTQKGLETEAIKLIGSLIFGALTLSLKGDLSVLIEDWVQLTALRFKYKAMPSPERMVISTVRELTEYPVEHAFTAGSLIFDKNPLPKITEHLKCLVDSWNKCMLWVSAPELEDKCTSTEKIYGIKYHQEPLPQEYVKDWERITKSSSEDISKELEIRLPAKNPFIPTNFDLVMDPTKIDESAEPSLISHTPNKRVYFKQDSRFKLPHFGVSLRLRLPVLGPLGKEEVAALASADGKKASWDAAKAVKELIAASSAKQLDWVTRNLYLALYFRAVEEALAEATYDAHVAGLSFKIERSDYTGYLGYNIVLAGFHDKADVLFDMVLSTVSKGEFTEAETGISYNGELRSLRQSVKAQDAYLFAVETSTIVSASGYVPSRYLLEAIELLSESDVHKILTNKALKADIFSGSGSSVEGVLCGNLTQKVAEEMVNHDAWKALLGEEKRALENRAFDLKSLAPEKFPNHFKLISPKESSRGLKIATYRVKALRAEDQNKAICLNVQNPDNTAETAAFTNLMQLWVSEAFFDSLRTKQTLGYVVASRTRSVVNLGLRYFLVQSSSSSTYVMSRILTFIDEFFFSDASKPKQVVPKDMDQETFEGIKDSVISNLKELPKRESELRERYMMEVVSERYDFKRREKQIQFLKNYTLDAFVKDIEKFLHTSIWTCTLIIPANDEEPLSFADIKKDEEGMKALMELDYSIYEVNDPFSIHQSLM